MLESIKLVAALNVGTSADSIDLPLDKEELRVFRIKEAELKKELERVTKSCKALGITVYKVGYNFECRSPESEYIYETVHELYYGKDLNRARTTLHCLSHLFNTPIEKQTFLAAAGLHGAGGYRAQCGLVEGMLMFIGIRLAALGKSNDEIVSVCRQYAEYFEKEFGSLRCRKLRPQGFNPDDAPHMCEGLT